MKLAAFVNTTEEKEKKRRTSKAKRVSWGDLDVDVHAFAAGGARDHSPSPFRKSSAPASPAASPLLRDRRQLSVPSAMSNGLLAPPVTLSNGKPAPHCKPPGRKAPLGKPGPLMSNGKSGTPRNSFEEPIPEHEEHEIPGGRDAVLASIRDFSHNNLKPTITVDKSGPVI